MRILAATLVLLSILTPELSRAQWALDGIPVTLIPGNKYTPMGTADGTGGTIITWADARTGDANVYVQRFSAAGVPLWTANGVAVCTAGLDQWVGGIVSDGAGGAIIVWDDFRNGTHYDVYAQRVNAGGAVQWALDGVVVCNAANDQRYPSLAADGSGGAVAVWQDYRDIAQSDVFAQRVNSAGAVQWAANGVSLCNAGGNQDFPRVVAVGVGGFIASWTDYRYGAADTDIYAQRVTPAGGRQWGAAGSPVCSVIGIQHTVRLATDDAGGAVVTWNDLRAGHYDIYAQRVDASGVAQWLAGGVGLCVLPDAQTNPQIVSDGAGGAVVAWSDDRSALHYDIYAQRVSAMGSPVWTQNGEAICTFGFDQYAASVGPDGAGGFIVAWSDERSALSDVYAQRVDGSGAVQWTTDGVAVCDAYAWQTSASGFPDGAGGTVFSWVDYRSGFPEVYAGRLDNVHGFPGHPEPILTSVADVPHDQGGKVAVNWSASSDDLIKPRTIDFYSVWRAVDVVPLNSTALTLDDIESLAAEAPGPIYLSTPDHYFERVGTQSAHAWPGYSFAASTRADSVLGGAGDEVFMVAAHYVYDNFVAFASNVMSGHSVDNLAPPAPLLLTAQRAGADVQLHWNSVKIPDLRDYSLYRATSSGVTPVPIHFLVSEDDTLAIDPNAPSSALYYIVTAVDVHANQSPPSNEASVSALTGVGDTPGLSVLSVLPNHPNPFAGSTTLEIGLPQASDLSVEVYDVAGRRVRLLEVKGAKAGWRQVPFAARGDDGQPLASGVYFYRVRAAGTTITRKMVIAR